MKKTTRVLVALLALTLVTSCFVGGTFAKYVVSDNSTDAARVAVWGVNVVASGDDLFNNEYTDTTNGLTVKSADDAKVVAPGTDNTEFGSTGMKFVVSGKPEVAVKFTYDFTATEDIFLGTGTYSDDTTGAEGDEYTNDAAYYPVVYTLTKDGAPVAEGNLAEIKDYFDGLSTDIIAPNTTLDATYVLTWAWEFGDPANNQKDTTLGNLAAGTATTTNDYNLDLNYALAITVEQVD